MEFSDEQKDEFLVKLKESMDRPIVEVQRGPVPPVYRTREVPVRLIAELHVMQDLGWIPSPSDYIGNMELKQWMGGPTKTERTLSDLFPKLPEDAPAPHTQVRRQPTETYYDKPVRAKVCHACQKGYGDHSFRCPQKPVTPEPPPFATDDYLD